jgi:hypothetical protein
MWHQGHEAMANTQWWATDVFELMSLVTTEKQAWQLIQQLLLTCNLLSCACAAAAAMACNPCGLKYAEFKNKYLVSA